jgi:hypothetical protein
MAPSSTTGAFADEDLIPDPGDAFAAVVESGPEVFGLEVISDAGEGFPGVIAALEKGGVFGLVEVEKVRGREHGWDGDGGMAEGRVQNNPKRGLPVICPGRLVSPPLVGCR